MTIFTDQMGARVELPHPPQRIISLVPSQTELLFDLDVGERVVGVTKYCVHPAEQVAQVATIGGTKKFKFEQIDTLRPDLILGNKEENYRAGIERLKERYPVWMSDIVTLVDAYTMIRCVGEMTETAATAQQLITDIQTRFATLDDLPPLRVAYLIWRRPYMAVGGDTFINSMLAQAGFTNVFEQEPRYPEVSVADLRTAAPDLLLLSSEPFPFTEKYLPEFEEQFPEQKILFVDGELFSWYGSRLKRAAGYFQELRATLE